MDKEQHRKENEVALMGQAGLWTPDLELFEPGELGAVLGWTVRKADGSIREQREVKSRSFVRQFLELLYTHALGAGDCLGSLDEGKLADIIGVHIQHDAGDDLLEQLILGESDVRLGIVNGEEVIADY